MDRNQLRLAASIMRDHALQLAGDWHPFGNPNATGQPGHEFEHLHQLATQHIGAPGSGHDADVVHSHITQAGYAAARGDHTMAEAHVKDAMRRVQARHLEGSQLHLALQNRLTEHQTAARRAAGLGPGKFHAGAGLGAAANKALSDYDAGKRLPAGPARAAIGRHIAAHVRHP